jgi:hypothetical protein
MSSVWTEIWSFSDSNMAGDRWKWVFSVRTDTEGTLSLRSSQKVKGQEDWEFVSDDLMGGADIYEALQQQLSEFNYDISSAPLEEIAKKLAKFGKTTADNFLNAEAILEAREEEEEADEESLRAQSLAPFREVIDRYVLRFSDTPHRFPGSTGTYGSPRLWATRFIENYLIEHGKLPTGQHWIKVQEGGASYSGEGHFFEWD